MFLPARLLLVVVILSAVNAQDPDAQWKRIGQLPSEASMQIHLRMGEVWKGTLARWDADRITLRRDGNPESVERAAVARVSRRSRARGALWGFLIGFGVAAPVGAYTGPYIADFGNPSAGTRFRHAMGWGGFFGGVSAGIGALVGKQVTVYRAGP